MNAIETDDVVVAVSNCVVCVDNQSLLFLTANIQNQNVFFKKKSNIQGLHL